MRRLLASTTLVLAAVSLTACGGPPDDASEKDFCKAASVEGLASDDFGDVEKWAEEMDEVGTPENIGDDEREGFEILLDVIDDSSDTDELEENGDDLDGDDEDKVDAFFEYVGTTCSE